METEFSEAELRTRKTLANSMGESILAYLADENVLELAVNTDSMLWIDTFDSGWVNTGKKVLPSVAKQIIYGVAAMAATVIDVENKPYLEAEMKPWDAYWPKCRFQAELPYIVDVPIFNIRKHAKTVFSLEDYVRQGTMTPRQREIIIEGIKNHENIIAAGGTSSGKTTLLNAVLDKVSETGDRLVIIEDTPELQCNAPNHVRLKTQKPYIDMNELLRMSLRLSPRRIVVGEVRGKEALTLLKAWNTGHDGGCATLHSDSALESLYRLEQMISEISVTPQQRTIGQAVGMVVYIRKEGVKRRISEIIRVKGYNPHAQEYEIEQVE